MSHHQQRQVRVRRAERQQVEWKPRALDQLIPSDHRVRLVVAFVESLDLSALDETIKAVPGVAGREAIDPQILVALWLYATIEGVGSARRLDRLCGTDVTYQWILGGITVNYHTLADFRTRHVAILDQLLTQSVASLLFQGLIELERIAQDGMRVRAAAGSSSFRREATLQRCLDEAQAHLQSLQDEAEQDSTREERRVKAARERAARERCQRLEAALQAQKKLAADKERHTKGTGKKARASTTDPEARVMKMADGGFRPAYNVQLATTVGSQVIVGVDVTNAGTDGSQLEPMVAQLQARYGHTPREYLADGGFVNLEAITRLSQQNMTVYLPIMQEEKKRSQGIDPYGPMKGDSDEVAAWRGRMGTEEGRVTYRQRAPTAEFPHAGYRNRGMTQVNVRGRWKVKAIALWQALAHNFHRMLALRGVLQPWTAPAVG